MNKEEWMAAAGFSEMGEIYCVGGGNTFIIKDELKKLGFVYSRSLGWHTKEPIAVPAPYKLVHFTFDEIYKWEPRYQRAFLYDNIRNLIEEKLS